jgi:lysyl-tRNA synthetase class 2
VRDSAPRSRRPDIRPDPSGRRRLRAGAVTVYLLVWCTRLGATLTIAAAVFPGPRRILADGLRSALDLGVGVRTAGTTLALVTGVGLFLLGSGLRRRKVRAWWLAVATTALLAVVNLAEVLDEQRGLVAVVVCSVLLAALWLTRRHFVARPDPGGLGRSVRTLLAFAGAGFGLVWLLLAINHRRLADSPGLDAEAAQAALSLVGVSGPLGFRVVWIENLTASIGLSFGVVAVVVAGYHLLRSPEPRPALAGDAPARLRALLGSDGDSSDSLGYFALRRDKAAVFAHGGRSAVSYRVLAGVALASGDPVGDVGAWPGVIAAYLAMCLRYGWSPAVLGCSERGARAWAKAGLDALELGDEAVLDADTFTLEGRAMRGVRQAVARMQRLGHTTAIRRVGELPDAERAEVAARAQQWRGGETERGFSMALSRVADPADPDAVLVTAYRDGTPCAMVQLVPWGHDGLSLDAMLRETGADNGVNELLVAELMAAASGLGVRRVSLNFAVFRSALERGERIGAGPVARVWARLLRIASRWWQIDSLYRFNAKFRPRWYPRYVMFPAVRDLPRILLAAVEAEGFGQRPRALLRVLGR